MSHSDSPRIEPHVERKLAAIEEDRKSTETLPNWVLHCANCRKQFVHSEVADDGRLSMYGASKPEFPAGGDELECPHCQHKAVYQRYQLTYRA
jgi:hypothetical protein